MLGNHGPAIASPTFTVKEKMQEMFVRLLFNQMVAKILKDQVIDSTGTPASLSDENIIANCNMSRTCSLISGRMPERGD